MEKKLNLLSAEQVSVILNINEITVEKLARARQIPCVYVKRRPRFSLERLKKHFDKIERAVK